MEKVLMEQNKALMAMRSLMEEDNVEELTEVLMEVLMAEEVLTEKNELVEVLMEDNNLLMLMVEEPTEKILMEQNKILTAEEVLE